MLRRNKILVTSYSKKQFDDLLALGFFPNQECMLKNKYIFLGKESEVSAVINLRFNLENFSFTKSQRRLWRKNEDLFTVQIKPVRITSRVREIYRNYAIRFKGYIEPDLKNFFNLPFQRDAFELKEIVVFDHKKPIAYSFIKIGEKSVASILGIYDFAYQKNGLGIYTMLKEIEFARSQNCAYYYPGYIMDNVDFFDYKTSFKNVEFLNAQNQWLAYKKKLRTDFSPLVNEEQKLNEIKKFLFKQGIEFEMKINIFQPFSLFCELDGLLEGVFIFFIKNSYGKKMILEYLERKNLFRLSFCLIAEHFEEVEESAPFVEYVHSSENYLTNVLTYQNIIEENSILLSFGDLLQNRDLLMQEVFSCF